MWWHAGNAWTEAHGKRAGTEPRAKAQKRLRTAKREMFERQKGFPYKTHLTVLIRGPLALVTGNDVQFGVHLVKLDPEKILYFIYKRRQ